MGEPTDYAGLLDPACLPDERAFDLALRVVEQGLTDATTCISIIEQLLSTVKPEPIAIFLSGISHAIPIETWIMDKLSFDKADFLESTTSRLLSSLSTFFMFHILLKEHREIVLELGKYYREAQDALSTTQALVSFCSHKKLHSRDKLGDSHSRKGHLRKSDDISGIALTLLATLEVPIPRNSKEASDALAKLLDYQKVLLCRYLKIVRMPEIGEEVKAGVISNLNQARSAVASTSATTTVRTEENPVSSTMQLSDYKLGPPISAQSYEMIDGFGDWLILISSRADSDLREWRRRDKTTFKIILKKIRDLSKGDFSVNNQHRVNRGDVVPIFEAKATFDCRLVYQVDCIRETTDKEKQVIRMFGVYSSMELKSQLWDAIGKQLSTKGKEYKDRCIYRSPLSSDKRHFLPAIFPSMKENLVEESLIADLLKDASDHELQTILILQKFIPFSRALLNSIFADLDAVFPFEVSPEEKAIIDHPFSCYVLGRSGTGKTTAMLHKMLWIERSFEIGTDGTTKARQMFVTQSSVLADKVKEYFNKMLESLGMSNKSPEELKAMAQAQKYNEFDDLVDKDEDFDLNSSLPSKFSDLRDEHFPLFLTFDHLCTLLEADIAGFNPVEAPDNHVHNGANQNRWNISRRRKENLISYNNFLGSYWHHFNQAFTKGLDSYSVFNELLGVIQGSEIAALSTQRCIDADTYETLSERSNPTFPTKRSAIYEIFQCYRKMKRQTSSYDAADRTHALLRSIQAHDIPGRKLDCIYIDEAQDNLMIDALLLRILCRNPDGLFWAGDTAQTISSGCSFRFQDLKSMLYRIEKQAEKVIPGSKSELPKTFYLAVNYRSHTGIVNCAHSVIELIQQHWPYSIDALAPEKGLIIGAPPVFLAERNSEDIQFEQFLFGSRKDSLEFGANQCIIVRNNDARDRLREKVGDIGIILTIYESKGLEFNDVLLYNFFEDSTLGTAQWRLILKEDTGNLGIPRLPFDTVKHVGLCSELKSLYVAITRAKKNMWIADCSEKANPIKEYWSHRDLISIRTAGEALPRLAETSTSEQWAHVGKMLFERKQYSQARNCFHRASLPREEAIAHAYALREHALRLPMSQHGSENVRRDAFIQAAEAFLSCSSKHSLVYFRKSGECFEAATQYLRAAEAYYRSENYTESILLYRRVGNFDEAIAILIDKEDKVRPSVADDLRNAARLFYMSRAEKNSTALRQARQLFITEEEMLEYSEDMCLDGARATILLSLGRSTEAVDCILADGRVLDAIKLLLKDRSLESTRRACSYILQELWKLIPFGSRVENVRNSAAELLSLSLKLNKTYLKLKDRSEIEMFQAIQANDCPTLRRLGEMFFDIQNVTASAYCFEQYYLGRLPPPIRTMALDELVESLRNFNMYIESMFTITFRAEPSDSSIHRFFGLETRGHSIFVPKNTFLYAYFEDFRARPSNGTEEGVLISDEVLAKRYQSILKEYLKDLLLEENELCCNCRALNPCLNFLIQGCRNSDCTRDHREHASFDNTWYNQRVHAHLIQIGMMQVLASLLNRGELNHHRTIWISRFYEALQPPHYILGSLAQLNTSLIPDYARCKKRLNLWIQELVYDLWPRSPKFFVTNVLSYLDLALLFDKVEAPRYIFRAKIFSPPPLREYLRQPGACAIREVTQYFVDESCRFTLTMGILFSKFVVEKLLPVDINVFCNFLEVLCGQSIIAKSRCRSRGVLHDVMLPKSWWIRLILKSRRNVDKSIQRVDLLFDVIFSLLYQLLGSDKTENLLYHSSPLKEYGLTTIGWIYVARLCRMACLLGHNLKWQWFNARQRILDDFRRLSSTAGVQIPSICKMYFSSYSWPGIVNALHTGSYDLAKEQLILVCHRHMPTFPSNLRLERYYRRILYIDERDLAESLLQAEGQLSLRMSSQEVPDSMSRKNGMEGKYDLPEHASLDQESIQDDNFPSHEEEGEQDDHYEPSQSISATQMVTLTEEEQKAGIIIRDTYKAYLRRKTITSNTSAQSTRNMFLKCLEHSQAMTWSRRSHYKLLYLGPLPCMLACLEILSMDITDKRAEAKKMLKGLEHQGIDEANAILTELSGHRKALYKLKEALGPKGNIHQTRNQEKLKATVQEAVTFVQQFPIFSTGDMRWNVEAVEKGILRENAAKAKGRPELQVEDDLEYYDDLY
ncbi:hypothetical protein APHAL10511_006583 [Amanita phalloides]|nr:hypothetical protein APHAL10511_006583 [Amanita phalloides]